MEGLTGTEVHPSGQTEAGAGHPQVRATIGQGGVFRDGQIDLDQIPAGTAGPAHQTAETDLETGVGLVGPIGAGARQDGIGETRVGQWDTVIVGRDGADRAQDQEGASTETEVREASVDPGPEHLEETGAGDVPAPATSRRRAADILIAWMTLVICVRKEENGGFTRPTNAGSAGIVAIGRHRPVTGELGLISYRRRPEKSL